MADGYFHPTPSSVWPMPSASIEHYLRHTGGALDERDRMHAASILAAYRQLLECDEQAFRAVRRAYRKQPAGPTAGGGGGDG